MTRFILRYRPTTAFAVIYATLALPAAAASALASVLAPEAGLAVAAIAGLTAFLIAATRAAAGQGIGPVRFVGGIGVPRVLALRRRRMRHAVAFAVLAGGTQACVLALLSVLVPQAADWPGPGTLAALLGVHAVLALAAIHSAACTLHALRRAFAMARPGL
jgi:hypothetical protein